MSSIGSTLNSINASLLSEIASFTANQSQTGSTTSSKSNSVSDQIDFSQIGQLFSQLQQLQTSNPTEFKQVLTDAATKFKAAAAQSTDPQQTAFLNNLAGKFQTAADTGNLSALKPDSSPGGSSGYSAHGHHHHHGGAGGASSANNTSGTSATPSPQDLLSSILGTSTGQNSSSTSGQVQSLLSTLFTT